MAMQITVLGIDLGKNSCSVVRLDGAGKVVLRRRLHRESVIKLGSDLAPCVMAMEACCGAHHLAATLSDLRVDQLGAMGLKARCPADRLRARLATMAVNAAYVCSGSIATGRFRRRIRPSPK
jgi:predicted NBD/HSP70 family sugar kinase